jgi:hypothetical protein
MVFVTIQATCTMSVTVNINKKNNSSCISFMNVTFAFRVSFSVRPSRHILVIGHPYAGAGQTRYIYHTTVKAMLERAGYKINYQGSI